MATEELKVKVSADVAGAVSGLNQVNTALSKTGPAVAKTGKDFTGLSRVIQDLPFGFTAISNNLTQLLPAAGAAGLAFSALVAGLTFAQTGLANWTRGLTGSKQGIGENEEALITFGNEIRAAMDDVEDFTNALDQINKIGKLRLDIDFGKGLGTDLLNLQGVSVGNRELLTKLEETEGIIQKKTSDIRQAFTELLEPEQLTAFDKGVLQISKLNDKQKDAFDRMSDAEKDLSKVQEDILKTRNQQNVVYAQIEQQKIDIIEDKNKKATDAQKKADDAERKRREAALKDLADFYLRGFQLTKHFDRVLGDVVLQARLELKLKKKEDTVGEKLLKASLPKTISPRVNIAPVPGDIKLDALKESLEAALNDALKTAAFSGFSAIGESIGAAVAGGSDPIKAAFESIGGTISDLISQIGKALIEYGVVKEGLDKILIGGILVPGAAAIAAGVAAVAIGALLKNSFKPKAFAAGGLAFGPTLGLVGEGIGTSRSNPEVIAPLDKLKNFIGGTGGTQVFIPSLELSYNKLMVAFNRAGKYGGLTS